MMMIMQWMCSGCCDIHSLSADRGRQSDLAQRRELMFVCSLLLFLTVCLLIRVQKKPAPFDRFEDRVTTKVC